MADLEADYRLHLAGELRKRKESNPRYSLRAFARSLGVDHGVLSKLVSGKQLLSLDFADSLSKKLRLAGEERVRFLKSAVEEQQCHMLYLPDPTLTDCEDTRHETNIHSAPRRKKPAKN